ncbi:hypothetical protein GGS26DRAFT_554107 [Hypomontagnella submonticulosa]|nr:hypothetical protein GGS26DRAFT_554107 [Hypomontagnella submonticulosa]
MAKIRRPHRKSRTGCIACKKRRIKCDEEKPTCAYCKIRSEPCVYPPPQSRVDRSSQPVDETVSTDQEDSAPQCHPSIPSYPSLPQDPISPILGPRDGDAAPPYPGDPIFGMRDLFLLHHWSTTVSLSMLKTPWVDQLFQHVLPRIAFHHPFLMHAVLSLAALHSAHLEDLSSSSAASSLPSPRSQDLVIDAVEHHNRAIPGFRDAIDNITQANCDAVFATAILNLFYVFATFGKRTAEGKRTGGECGEVDHDDAEKPADTRSQILGVKWINLIRGVGAVVRAGMGFVRAGPLSRLSSIGDWEETDPDVEKSAEDEVLLRLESIWRTGSYQAEEAELYSETLRCLRRTVAWMNKGKAVKSEDHWLGPFIWLHMVPEEYFDRLWQRQPPALVLFAYFGVVVHSLDEFWWVEGWGVEIVKELDKILGSYWSSWLKWPRKEVGLN